MGCCAAKEDKEKADAGAGPVPAGAEQPRAPPAEAAGPSPASGEDKVPVPTEYNPDVEGITEEERGQRRVLREAFYIGLRGEPLLRDWKDDATIDPEERADRQSLRNAFGRGRRANKKRRPNTTTAGSTGGASAPPRPPSSKNVPNAPPSNNMVKVQGGKPPRASTLDKVKGIKGEKQGSTTDASSSGSSKSKPQAPAGSDPTEAVAAYAVLSAAVVTSACEEAVRAQVERESNAATQQRIEELEARAEEAERRVEQLQDDLERTKAPSLAPRSPRSPISPHSPMSASASNCVIEHVSDEGESTEDKQSVIKDTDSDAVSATAPECKKTELRDNLGVYTLETQLDPAGTLYGIQNDSDFTVVVVLSFIGSENIDLKVDEVSEARGTKVTMVQPPYGMEASCEVGPKDRLDVVKVVPDNMYAAWTVAVASRWQLLTTASPGRGPSEAPMMMYEVPAAAKELAKLDGGGWKAAVAQSLPFVDASFVPSAKVTVETDIPTNSWRRSEKIIKKTVLNALYPRDCKMTAQDHLRWLTMALALILDNNADIITAAYPALVVPNKKGKDLERVGGYESWWCVKGWWRKVLTDSYIPVNGKKPVLVASDEVWPSLTVKAYAKARQGFGNVRWGTVGHFLQDITGCPYKRIPLTYAANETNTKQVEKDGEYMALWDDLKVHIDAGRVVGASTKEHLETEKTWRGDCDVELVDLDGVRPLWGIPPDTTLPVLGYSEDMKLKVRNRWGWPVTPGVSKIDTSDRWVEYADFLNAFTSVTIGYVTPGWNDVRVAVHADGATGCSDTFLEIHVTEHTTAHVWLGAADETPALLGIAVLQPVENNRYSDYSVHTLVGVELSGHVWGEVDLPPSSKPYVVLPLIMDTEGDIDSGLRRAFTLCVRTSEESKGNISVKACNEDIVFKTELMAMLQYGESKVIAEDDATGKNVTLKVWQQYRLLGCCVRNSTDYPVRMLVNYSGSQGYDLLHCGPGVVYGAPLRFQVDVPAKSSRHICALAAQSDSWEYSLEAESQWLPQPPTKERRQKDAIITPSSSPYIYKEIQLNGDTQQLNQTPYPTPL